MGDKLIINWKSICKERSWPNFKVLSEHSLGGTEGNHEPQNSWTLGGGFNTGLLEYNAGVLTTRLKRSVVHDMFQRLHWEIRVTADSFV
jgi:hypothetical protein